MTVVVELTQADGHTESLTVPRTLAPDIHLAAALFQTERGRRHLSDGLQLFSGLVAQQQRIPWDDIENQDLVKYMYDPTQELDSSEAIQEFFSPSLYAWIDLEIAFPGQKATINALALMAYLARAIRREDLTSERFTREMDLVIHWLLSHEEYSRRLRGQSIGGILFLLALSSPEDYQRFEVDQWVMEWISVASRRQVIDRGWAKDVLGEQDPNTLEKEIRSVVGGRLALEMNRLRSAPVMDVALKAISGELNFHKAAAKQAVIRGWRRKHERHVLVDDPFEKAESDKKRTRFHTEPEERQQAKKRQEKVVIAHDVASVWGGPAESDPVHEAEVAADVERVIAAVKRDFRLTRSEAKVVSYVVSHPESYTLTHGEIAEGADVSLRTFYNTIRKLAGGKATLYRIFPHSIFPRQ